jgi:hypothetical protein
MFLAIYFGIRCHNSATLQPPKRETKFSVSTKHSLTSFTVNLSPHDTTMPNIYLLTPYSTVLLEKLTVSQLVKKFPTFYGTWRFITAFTRAHHLPLSWASSIYSMPSHPTSWRSISILSSHIRLVGESNGKLPLRTCPGCSIPKPYRSSDWALVSAQTSPRAEYQ